MQDVSLVSLSPTRGGILISAGHCVTELWSFWRTRSGSQQKQHRRKLHTTITLRLSHWRQTGKADSNQVERVAVENIESPAVGGNCAKCTPFFPPLSDIPHFPLPHFLSSNSLFCVQFSTQLSTSLRGFIEAGKSLCELHHCDKVERKIGSERHIEGLGSSCLHAPHLQQQFAS